MKKSEPKMIINIGIENAEFEEKIKTAIDEYAEDLVLKNLDDKIKDIVEKRIERLIKGDRWGPDSKIRGVYFGDFVKEKTNSVIEEVIDKNIKEVFARKVAEML